MICLDVSNYDHPTFDAACLRAAGVDRLIVGCQRPALAADMVAKAQTAGIEVIGTYAFLYFGIDFLGQTDAAIAVAKASGVRRVWLDVEATGQHERAGMSPGVRCAELAECVARVEAAGLEAGIYTGAWYWVPYMKSAAFAHLPLWHAAYPTDGSEVREVAYGGWTKVAIHQYTSGLNVCGRDRDANYVFEDGDEMTEAEVKKIVEEALGTWFPNYLKAAFEAVPGRFSDRPDLNMTFPYRPWFGDIANADVLASRLESAARALRGQA